MTLRVNEIFTSIQGESSFAGLPCTFVRLSGCNLNCRYCDTKYALVEGLDMSLDEVLTDVHSKALKLVEVTGGEPLLQPETVEIMSSLLAKGHDVLLETNGSIDISIVPEQVVTIMDLKCPSSGENDSIHWENIWKLRPHDEIKFVISDRHDYEWASGIIRERFGRTDIKVLLSIVFGELPPRRLVEWMLADKLQARFQLQMHKYIWPHDARGV
jgi:7-carboxy-7-deazaguanine synthase